jgi:hypothetical protein
VMEVPERTKPHGVRKLPVAGPVALWLVVSLVGVVISLQLMFLAVEVARPLIGPIPDDSTKERVLVAGGYAVWFGLSALISIVAWRILLRR